MLQLSRQDIEFISRRLLSEYLKKQITRIDKIDPVDFAEKMCGLRFAFADISVTGAVLGFTASMDVKVTISRRDGTQDDFVLDGKTAYIDRSLAAEGQTGRLNFTMMHEASHLLYARLFPSEYNGWQRRCVCRLADECTRYPVHDWEEWQANVLTSYLLLPRELVFRHLENVGLPQGIKWLNRVYAPKDYHRFSEAARRLGVSKTALAIRLSQIGLIEKNEFFDPYSTILVFPDKNEIDSEIA